MAKGKGAKTVASQFFTAQVDLRQDHMHCLG